MLLRAAASRRAAGLRSGLRSARSPGSPRVSFSSAKPSGAGSAAIPLSVGVSAGGFAGVVSALTGVGGGIILIPTLARYTTLPQQVINGTSIGAVSVSASVGAYNHLDTGACNLPVALATTLPAVICTRYGVRTAQSLTSKRLSLVVGAAMLLSSPLIFLKKSAHFPKFSANASPLDLQFYRSGDLKDPSSAFVTRAREDLVGLAAANAKYLAAGAAAGFLSGLCGLGGGILMTAYLTAASDMPQEVIIGTSLLGIVPTAVASTYHNVQANAIHLPSAARVGGSLAIGVYLTSKYVTHDVPEDVLRGVLGSTLAAAALVMMRRAL